MGIVYRDMETIKKQAKRDALIKLVNPNFTPIHKFSITTTPELLGLMRRKIIVRIK